MARTRLTYSQALEWEREPAIRSPAASFGPGRGGNLPCSRTRVRQIPGASPREDQLGVGVGCTSSVFRHVRSRRHGEHDVLSFLAICFRNAQQQLVLVNAKFGSLADRKKRRVLVIFRPDSVRNALRPQHILLAKCFLCLLVLSVGAQNLPSHVLAVLFSLAAL